MTDFAKAFGLIVTTALLHGAILSAAEIPRPIIPEGVGVNIHFTKGHEQDLDMIAAAGFKFVRMDFTWELIEQKKGEYDWSHYDELTANLQKRGLRAIYILDYSNHLYEEPVDATNPFTQQPEKRIGSPQHPESIAAFANWAAAAAKHFHGKGIIWEIYNEPNIFFWKPQPKVEQYTALALATAKAIREAERKATIIAPATSGIPMDFLETFFKSGVLEYLDAVSVHPYRGDPPETAAEDYRKLRQLIDRYAPRSRKEKISILSGEWGYSAAKGQFPVETQAAYAVRQQLFNLSEGIPLSIWYDWKNDGPDINEVEHNFGTVTQDLKPKPAYIAFQTLTKELTGYHFVRRLKTERPGDFVLLLEKAGSRQLAAWTTDDSHSINAEGINLDLSPMPKYFPTKLK